MTPVASVVVPAYGRPSDLMRLLAACAQQTMAPERFQVVVSLDGPQPRTRALLTALRPGFELVVVEGPHAGRASACNRGVDAAHGDLVVMLDDDMEPAPGWLAAHVAAHAGARRRCVVGAAPIATQAGETRVRAHYRTRFNAHLARLASPGHRMSLRDFYSGNCSLRRDVLTEVGLYHIGFREYGNEDLELALRLTRAGVEIVFSQTAEAAQAWDKTYRQVAADAFAKGRTAVQLEALHPGTATHLRLGTYDRAPAPVRLARRPLVEVIARSSPARAAAVAVGALVDRGPAPAWLYERTGDLLYFAGAFSAGWRPRAARPIRRVVHYTDSTVFGGAEQAIVVLMTEQRRAGLDPVLLHPGSAAVGAQMDAADLAHAPVPPMPEGLAGGLRVPRLIAQLRRLRPDVFHAHLTWPMGCKWALVAAGAARVGVVAATAQLFVDIPVGASRRAQLAVLHRVVDPLIAVSQGTADEMVTRMGWPRRRVHVVRNAVPAPTDGPGDVDRGRAVLGPDPVALVVARLDAQKGHDVVLSAAELDPSARYACVGDGALRAALEADAARRGVGDRVRFLGFRTDVADLVAAAPFVVLASRYEGLPLSLLEAMAAGRAVVATDIPGTRELVVHEQTGLLVPADDAAALAAAVARVRDDAELRDRLARAGQAHVRAAHSSRAMADAVLAAYRGAP